MKNWKQLAHQRIDEAAEMAKVQITECEYDEGRIFASITGYISRDERDKGIDMKRVFSSISMYKCDDPKEDK